MLDFVPHLLRYGPSAFALVLMVSLVAVAAIGSPARGDDGETPECIDHRGDARYRGYGYDHVVVITSGCQEAARCTVSTDVTPEEHQVDVPAGETVEVLTRRGSPAREFTPQVACTLR